MASSRAKDLKRKKIMFGLMSTLAWVVTGIVLVIIALSKFKAKDSSGTPIFSNEIKATITSINSRLSHVSGKYTESGTLAARKKHGYHFFPNQARHLHVHLYLFCVYPKGLKNGYTPPKITIS